MSDIPLLILKGDRNVNITAISVSHLYSLSMIWYLIRIKMYTVQMHQTLNLNIQNYKIIQTNNVYQN